MRKYITCIFLVIASLTLNARGVRAYDAGASASLKSGQVDSEFDYRTQNLRNFLEKYDSPLAVYANDFVTLADNYGVDYRIVPAISGVESTFGKRIPSKSFNAYGWANGAYKFASWTDSIDVVTSTLKTKYIDKGATSITKIARIYAPPSTTWAGKVNYFVGKIDTLPLDFDIVI